MPNTEGPPLNEKPKRQMNPNSLEALKRGREKAFAKRAALNLGEKKRLEKEARLLEKEEVVKKKVDEIVQLRQKVDQKFEAKVQQKGKAAKAAPQTKSPPSSDDDTCPEAVDWKNYYKEKYKAKLSSQKEPEYAILARDKLRQQATAHAKRLAWESMFPNVALPF